MNWLIFGEDDARASHGATGKAKERLPRVQCHLAKRNAFLHGNILRGFVRISPETKSSKIQKPDNKLFCSLFFGNPNCLLIGSVT
jgi:hypothetical protein